MTLPRLVAVPTLALLVALGASISARHALAQPGTPGQGSAVGGEAVPAPGSTTDTMAEPEAPSASPPPAEAPSPTPTPTPTPSPTPTPTPTPSATPTPSPTPTPSATPNPAPEPAETQVAPAAPVAPEPAPEASEEDAEDDDRVRLFYLEVAAGYTWINLGQFRDDNISPEIVRIEGSGVGVSGGAGLQLAFVTLGLQGEWARYPDFDLGTLALDVGFRFPIPLFQPYLRVGLGYGWVLNVDEHGAMGEFPQGVEGIQGLVADAGIGIDITLTDLFSVNLGFDAAFLAVNREPSSITGFAGDPTFVPDADGEALGLQLSLLAGINLRF